MNLVTFHTSARNFILDAFNKTVDTDGYIVEKDNPRQRVLIPEGEEVHESEFGGIRKGSEIFIKSDLISLIHLYDALYG